MTIKREPRLYDQPKTIGADYAGRLDLIAECEGEWKGAVLSGVYVLDWKSSKEPADERGYAEWPLQVAGYRNGAASHKDVREYIDGEAIIRLDKATGIPTIYDYTCSYKDDLEAFHHLVRFYRKTEHEYYERGIPSVTSILGILAKPALIQWAANCSRDWVLAQLNEYLKRVPGGTVPVGFVEQWAEEAPKNFRKVSKAATDIGKEVHALIEKDLKGEPEPKNWNLILPEAEIAYGAYLDFKKAVQLKPLHIELKIYGRAA